MGPGSAVGSLRGWGSDGSEATILIVPLLPGGSPGGVFSAAPARPPGTAAMTATSSARTDSTRTTARPDQLPLVAPISSPLPPWTTHPPDGSGTAAFRPPAFLNLEIPKGAAGAPIVTLAGPSASRKE